LREGVNAPVSLCLFLFIFQKNFKNSNLKIHLKKWFLLFQNPNPKRIPVWCSPQVGGVLSGGSRDCSSPRVSSTVASSFPARRGWENAKVSWDSDLSFFIYLFKTCSTPIISRYYFYIHREMCSIVPNRWCTKLYYLIKLCYRAAILLNHFG
jgi:hypothetical protein